MRCKLSCTEFYPCYLQQCYLLINATQLTYSLIRLLAMARRVIWIRSVRHSAQKFSWNWLFFFVELKMVLGAMWCYVWQWDFLKKMFYLQNGENRPTPGFFECIGKLLFLSSLFFFISLIYNESSYYCNSCMLEQIFSYLGKFWYLRYGPKCSWPTRLQDFSIAGLQNWLYLTKKLMTETGFWCVPPSVFSGMAL